MLYNKLYQINRTNNNLDKTFLAALYFITFRPIKASTIYTLHKTKIVFTQLKDSNNITFLDVNKNVLIQDKIENYTFYKFSSKIIEIEHPSLEKNIPLILDENVTSLFNFLEQRHTKFEKRKKVSFLDIMELIFMP